MTVGRMSGLCWALFVVMGIVLLPLVTGLDRVHVPIVLTLVVVAVLWWGPFVYAIYLGIAVIRNGDRRLLRRGVRGTAVVLSATATNTRISKGTGDASRVYKYRLRVSVPGRAPYETVCTVCARGIDEGATVNVGVSRHNHRRVTIDVGQAGRA